MARSTPRFTFLLKILVVVLLVVAADRLFPDWRWSTTAGVLALFWTAGVTVARPALRRPGPALTALGAALLFAGVLVYDPSLLAWSLFWAALAIAALLPRTAGFDDAYRWAARLLLHVATGPAALLRDLAACLRLRRRSDRPGFRSVAAVLALPLVGGALFVALFASANPLIEDALARIELPPMWRVLFWLAVAVAIWPAFRPRRSVIRIGAALPDPEITVPGASLPSVLIALALFNILFGIENGLDLAFLWSGAPLPPGMSMTDYVHRGAYPLIVTALLAGLFVLAALKPGSVTAASPAARRLVVLWVVQNLLLVASSALRTVEYIDEYLLTRLRIAALAWMALVACGLVLICWRVLRSSSARWLVNANALAAGLVLAVASMVDLGAVAAAWNVTHAREVGGRGEPLDLCYLAGLGSPALVPLARLEMQPRLAAAFRDRVRAIRQDLMQGAEQQQADWRAWT